MKLYLFLYFFSFSFSFILCYNNNNNENNNNENNLNKYRNDIFLQNTKLIQIRNENEFENDNNNNNNNNNNNYNNNNNNNYKKRINYNSVCIFTISAWNNYGFVQFFFDSVSKSNPEIKCHVWVVADTPNYPEIITNSENENKNNFKIVTVSDLINISPYSIDELAFKFDLVEFSTTIKPLAFLYLFQVLQVKHALYFDNDCWITHSLDDLISILQYKLTVVTPHISVPIPEDGRHQRDINILKAGVLNFGFVSFTYSEKTIQFILWWYERLRFYGYVLLEKGMHFDQNWGHFIFVFFNSDEFYVIRDVRYNIAYWNLHYTGSGLKLIQNKPYINNLPVIFMHLSGVSLFEEYDLNTISRHQNRYTLQNFPNLEPILKQYISHVTSFDVEKYRKIPYGYNYFSDNSIIPKIVKQYYIHISDSVNVFDSNPFSLRKEAKEYFESLKISNPFLVSEWLPQQSSKYEDQNDLPKSFAEFLLGGPYNFIVNCEDAQYFSELEHVIYRQRSDLQHVFPDPFDTNYWDFKHWFSASVPSEYNIRGGLLDMWRRRVNKASRMAKLGPTREKLFGVTVIGWHNGMFGVGISASMLFNNLLITGTDVKAMLLYDASVHKHIKGRIPDSYITRSPTLPINIFVANADNTPLLHDVYPNVLWKRHYNIGVWAWELDIFPSDWMPHLNHFDEIWVPSTFVQKSIEASPLYSKYPKPIHVFPFGYSKKKSEDYSKLKLSRNIEHIISDVIIPSNIFVFFLVFDYYSVFDRKNPVAAIHAFRDAFPNNNNGNNNNDNLSESNVMLIIKSSKPDRNFQLERNKLLEEINNDNRIQLIERAITDSDMQLLFSRMDCYVSLHRSEGYGINILEAMLAGKPTIATNYGGNVDFFNSDPLVRQVHFPIDYDLIPVDTNKYNYNPYKIVSGARWADPKHVDSTNAMIQVVKIYGGSNNYHQTQMDLATEKLKILFGDYEVGNKMLARLKLVNWISKVEGNKDNSITNNDFNNNHNHNNNNNNNNNININNNNNNNNEKEKIQWKNKLPDRGTDRAARLHKRVVGTVRYAPGVNAVSSNGHNTGNSNSNNNHEN